MTLSKFGKGFLAGAALCLAASLFAAVAAQLPWNHKLQVSALTLAIIAGIAVGNIASAHALQWLHPGLRFSQQTLLRFGIVLYGVRLTVQARLLSTHSAISISTLSTLRNLASKSAMSS